MRKQKIQMIKMKQQIEPMEPPMMAPGLEEIVDNEFGEQDVPSSATIPLQSSHA